VFRQNGTPADYWAPPPFDEDVASGNAQAIFGWTSPAGEAEILYTSPAAGDAPLSLYRASRTDPEVWTTQLIMDDFHAQPLADGATLAATLYRAGDAEPLLFLQNTREPVATGDFSPPTAPTGALLAMMRSGDTWARVAILDPQDGVRFRFPVALSVGCSRPALYFVEERPATAEQPAAIALRYLEAGE
jgi:hypothetical protein